MVIYWTAVLFYKSRISDIYMSVVLWIVIVTFISGVLGTGLGGLVGSIAKRDSSRVVSLFLSFAGGVMLSIVCFDLVADALSPEDETGALYLFLTIVGLFLGYAVVYVLNRIIDKRTNHEVVHIDENHPATADDLGELIHSDHYNHHRETGNWQEMFIAGIIMACAIALHNLPEGIVIGVSYAGATTVMDRAGLIMAIIIGLHNIPEGMAVSVPLISGGMSKSRAVLVTALSGFPTVIGALIGYGLGGLGTVALSLALSFAAGAMIYVVFGELIPEAILMWRSKAPAFAILAGMTVGLIVIYV